jgi:ribonuclease HI
MKALKVNHDSAQLIQAGKRHSTWRINDDKDLHVNDIVMLIDQINPIDPSSWQEIGKVKITQILEKQLGQLTQSDIGTEETLTPLEDRLTLYRKYYGPQVRAETPVKIVFFTPEKPVEASSVYGATNEQIAYKLFTDGGSRGNPGPSACGYVLMDMNDAVIEQDGLFLGVTTNNQAEYQSLKLGLEKALKHKAQVIYCHMDSMLVINQMKGLYKVKNLDLVPLNTAVKGLVTKFSKVVFTYVPREHNRRADEMVNKILDAQAPETIKNHPK